MIIRDHRHAIDYFDDFMDKMKLEVEEAVAKKYMVAQGAGLVYTADLRRLIRQAVAEWFR